LVPHGREHITSTEELDAHRGIAEAVRRRQGERAEQLMLEHLNESALTLIKGFSGMP
jgi:DNA-binding GntR family transcriptional regulator